MTCAELYDSSVHAAAVMRHRDEGGFMRYHRLKTVTGVVLLICAAASSMVAQETRTLKFDASNTVFIHELGAAVGVSEEDAALKFLFVAPAGARQGTSATVDVKTDDLLLMADGTRVRSIADFKTIYEACPVGETLKIGIRRGEERFLRSFTRAEQPADGAMTGGGTRMRIVRTGGEGGDVEILPGLGVVLQASDGVITVAAVLPLPDQPPSPLAEGDTIVSFQGTTVNSLAEVKKAYDGIEVGAKISVTVERGGSTRDFELTKNSPPKGMVIQGSH